MKKRKQKEKFAIQENLQWKASEIYHIISFQNGQVTVLTSQDVTE